jgi:hypothetical protein
MLDRAGRLEMCGVISAIYIVPGLWPSVNAVADDGGVFLHGPKLAEGGS